VVAAANPAFFAVNGVRFAACTQDVLRHLSAAEAAREEGPNGDRMARLAAHLPGQRSAYPLFPAARAACLDASLAAHLEMDVTPDVLVLPSDLNPFAKIVPRVPEPAAAATAPALPARVADADADDAFVAVNPGRVAKGNAGGAFALMRIAEHAPAGPGEHAHAVGKRTRVDIVRV
jgi:DNA polymerase alpha subunit B